MEIFKLHASHLRRVSFRPAMPCPGSRPINLNCWQERPMSLASIASTPRALALDAPRRFRARFWGVAQSLRGSWEPGWASASSNYLLLGGLYLLIHLLVVSKSYNFDLPSDRCTCSRHRYPTLQMNLRTRAAIAVHVRTDSSANEPSRGRIP